MSPRRGPVLAPLRSSTLTRGRLGRCHGECSRLQLLVGKQIQIQQLPIVGWKKIAVRVWQSKFAVPVHIRESCVLFSAFRNYRCSGRTPALRAVTGRTARRRRCRKRWRISSSGRRRRGPSPTLCHGERDRAYSYYSVSAGSDSGTPLLYQFWLYQCIQECFT